MTSCGNSTLVFTCHTRCNRTVITYIISSRVVMLAIRVDLSAISAHLLREIATVAFSLAQTRIEQIN